jgi:hypothetical protein
MKHLVIVAFFFACQPALAHEDRSLGIDSSGKITGLPQQYGTTRVEILYSNSRDVTKVRLSGKNFDVKLNRCVLDRLTNVIKVRASGSWYHELAHTPPYVTLDFLQELPAEDHFPGEGIRITFSLIDGKILLGDHRYDPWWGSPRGGLIRHADSCKGWQDLALWGELTPQVQHP